MIILTPLPSWSLFSCSSSTTPFVHPSPFIVHRLKSILLLLSENEQFVRRRTPPVYLFTSIRQTNCETGSLSFLRSNRDDSIQTSDDGLTNTQSQPGSLGKTVDFIESSKICLNPSSEIPFPVSSTKIEVYPGSSSV